MDEEKNAIKSWKVRVLNDQKSSTPISTNLKSIISSDQKYNKWKI